MSVSLYMDAHVPFAIVRGLRRRNVDVLTAQEDGTTTVADSDLLDRATALGRVLFSQDDDLLAEAAIRQRTGQRFAGLIYAHQQRFTIGRFVSELEIAAQAGEPADFENRVVYLPI
jgi:hypothetical protein